MTHYGDLTDEIFDGKSERAESTKPIDMKRFLSFLGTGNYQPCQYRFGERMSPEVVYVQTAINLFAAPRCEEAVVFCTTDAKAKHAEGLVAEFARNGLPAPRLVDIPEGSSEEQLWRIFRIVRDIVGDGDEIMFDVTHSFRSLPVVMTVLLRYLSVAKGVTLGQCLYGAWDARNTESNVAPVFDLTPFFALDDWTHAILDFERSGDPSEMKRLAAGRLGPLCRTDASSQVLNRAVKDLGRFAENVRVSNLGVENKKAGVRNMSVHTGIAIPLVETAGGIPELEPLLRRLGERFASYGDTDVRNGFLAARWAAEHGLVPQAYTMLQETALSCLVERFRASLPPKPKLSPVGEREFVAGVVSKASDPKYDWAGQWTRPPDTAAFAQRLAAGINPDFSAAYDRLTKRRNALNHAGTNPEEPVSPERPEYSKDGFLRIADNIESSLARCTPPPAPPIGPAP